MQRRQQQEALVFDDDQRVCYEQKSGCVFTDGMRYQNIPSQLWLLDHKGSVSSSIKGKGKRVIDGLPALRCENGVEALKGQYL